MQDEAGKQAGIRGCSPVEHREDSDCYPKFTKQASENPLPSLKRRNAVTPEWRRDVMCLGLGNIKEQEWKKTGQLKKECIDIIMTYNNYRNNCCLLAIYYMPCVYQGYFI